MKPSHLIATASLTAALILGGCGNKEKEEKHEHDNKTEEHQHSYKSHKTLTGKFKSGEEHVEGNAKIENGKIMLTDFKSAKGPDLYVYLTKDGNIKEGKQLEMVDYNKPEQTFDIQGADLDKYNEVTIYCKKAHVIFGAAKVK
ncbi:DM13 domain-containing protein [Staphylococcus carnosus]|uniref:DM13 domain-containing protein n=1 Tax=Staphylococcus carnosus TaxID=1281 RepID=UPI00081A6398|nr:DM13 domain-containing protein [Staphylococcus carnosus]ANZ34017.1 hypothetical protein BEK99_09570 [Staphylococcus carnosus]UTB81379.1 hypothetical protein A2I65_10955 [Staphylococcus carnosus]UTB86199.1 hypothetical protein A2I66_11170 [Staphylococcus carnosus]